MDSSYDRKPVSTCLRGKVSMVMKVVAPGGGQRGAGREGKNPDGRRSGKLCWGGKQTYLSCGSFGRKVEKGESV